MITGTITLLFTSTALKTSWRKNGSVVSRVAFEGQIQVGKMDYLALWLFWDTFFVVIFWMIEKLVERIVEKSFFFHIFGYGYGVIDGSLFMQVL